MAKKIQIAVSADTAEAQKRIEALGQTAENGMMRGAQAAEKFAQSANKAAQAAEKASNATKQIGEGAQISSRQITHMVASFATIGVGIATSYAASRMERDDPRRAAMEYGGGALVGAGMGAQAGMFLGPAGAAAGALIGGGLGALKVAVDRDNADRADAENEHKKAEAEVEAKRKTLAANVDLVESFNRTRARTLEQRKLFEELADSTAPLAERMARLNDRTRQLNGEISALERDLQSGKILEDPKKFAQTMGDYQAKLAERDKLKGTAKSLQKAGDDNPRFTQAFDSLARVGGFMGGDTTSLGRQQLDATKESVNVLKRIEAKTTKTETTWS